MNTVLQHSQSTHYVRHHRTPVWSNFITWCKGQERNRFMWLAIAITGHGCFFTPLTLWAVMSSGNLMFLWGLAIGAMTISLISNLAAMPTKITIPIFFISLFIDLGVIITAIALPFITAN